jgi:AraC family transcriptional regulator of arabinose operon
LYEVMLQGNQYPLIRDIGSTLTQSGWVHPDRIPDYNVLIYLIHGQMQVIENGTEYILREGDAFFLKSGIHHWGGNGTLPGTSTIWIHFYDSVTEPKHIEETEQTNLRQFLMFPTYKMFSTDQYDFRIMLPKIIKVKNVPYMIRKLKELHELYNSSRSFRHLYLSMGAMDLFLDIYQQSQEYHLLSKSDIVVRKLVKYLEEHCNEVLDTEQVRNEFQLNYNYLSTLFKTKLGTNIFKYHERLRVHQAAELLKNTSMNISEVSEKVCFKSPYYFSRVFKKVMGESPSDYIKNIYRM